MYRSLGELHAYAREAYDYFARHASRDTGTDAVLPSPSRTGGLDKCGVECAMHALFGTTPSASLLSVLFPCPRHTAAAGTSLDETSCGYDRPARVDEATFLRFVTSYAEQHEGDALLQQKQASSRAMPGGGVAAAASWSVTAWLLFEALAADKGYITLQDLSAADVVSPFAPPATDNAQEEQSNADTAQQLLTSMDAQRRNALLSHVFAVLDRDHDGKLQFSDLMPECASQTSDLPAAFSCNATQRCASVPAFIARTRRKQERALRYRRARSSHLHWGVVAEPYMSPLHGVNLLLRSLGKSGVTVAEAAQAVEDVTRYYDALAQAPSSQPPSSSQAMARAAYDGQVASQQHSQGATAAAHHHHDHTAHARNSSASAIGPASLLTASQAQHLTQQGGTQPGQSMRTDIQDALVLEVLKELCAARQLRLTRMGYRDLRKIENRLGLVDVIPRRRAIVVADRRDPVFTIILGVARDTRGANTTFNSSFAAGATASGIDSHDVHTAPGVTSLRQPHEAKLAQQADYMHIIATAPVPIPWRRLVRKRLPRFSYKECVVAFVELAETPSETASEAPPRTPRLLGDTASSRGASPVSSSQGNNDAAVAAADRALTGGNSKNVDSGDDEADARSLACPATPFVTREEALSDDPLLRIPRVEVAGAETHRRRRGWVERLFLANATNRRADLSKLYHYLPTG